MNCSKCKNTFGECTFNRPCACECHKVSQEKEIDKEESLKTYSKEIDLIRAADRAALVRAVEGLRKSDKRVGYSDYTEALDDVLALLHSPEKK